MKKLLITAFLLISSLAQAQTSSQTLRWDGLNFNDAFPIVKGNGARKIAIFEDPNCPYCKQFEGTLARLNNVTFYIFLYPILGEDSIKKSTNIWCSENRVYAWQQWMSNNVRAQDKTCSSNPTYRNISIGKYYKFNGTPTIVFQDGTKEVGAITSEQIEAKFTAIYGAEKPTSTITPTNSTQPPVSFKPSTNSQTANPFK